MNKKISLFISLFFISSFACASDNSRSTPEPKTPSTPVLSTEVMFFTNSPVPHATRRTDSCPGRHSKSAGFPFTITQTGTPKALHTDTPYLAHIIATLLSCASPTFDPTQEEEGLLLEAASQVTHQLQRRTPNGLKRLQTSVHGLYGFAHVPANEIQPHELPDSENTDDDNSDELESLTEKSDITIKS